MQLPTHDYARILLALFSHVTSSLSLRKLITNNEAIYRWLDRLPWDHIYIPPSYPRERAGNHASITCECRRDMWPMSTAFQHRCNNAVLLWPQIQQLHPKVIPLLWLMSDIDTSPAIIVESLLHLFYCWPLQECLSYVERTIPACCLHG
jgi:hypothetical protein